MHSPQVFQPFQSTLDRDPYDYYDRLLAEKGDIFWDEDLNAWLVKSHEGIKEMLRRDDANFYQPERHGEIGKIVAELQGGPRHIQLLSGEEHLRMHQLWLRMISPRRCEEWRPAIIGPIINGIIDRFIERGHAEMSSEFSNLIPMRVMSRAMGLPWQDEDWMTECKRLNDIINKWFGLTLGTSHSGATLETPLLQEAREASRALNEMVAPFIEERRAGTGDDLISMIWREGPGVLDNFDHIDTQAAVRIMLQAGADSTSYAINNQIYMFIKHPELHQKLRDGGDKAASGFVEEVLRLYGVVHFRSRQATTDTQVAGCPIMRGQNVLPMVAAANRDPDRYPRANEIDLEREAPRDHFAFHFGIRLCVGAGLARAEMQEVTRALVTRLPDLQFDPEKEQPAMKGWLFRAYRPLNVVFAPGRRASM